MTRKEYTYILAEIYLEYAGVKFFQVYSRYIVYIHSMTLRLNIPGPFRGQYV
jgi:hypothetical protein